MDEQRPEKITLNLVQLLRGVASLLVVMFHATGSLKDIYHINFLGGFFSFGWSGVDIFFVLSGFIITYTSQKSLRNYSGTVLSFLKRRFIRIFPMYWIIITILLALQLIFPSFYGMTYDLYPGNLLSTYLVLPGHIMINGVSWTLSYELFFYLLFSTAFFIRQKILLLTASILFLLSIIIMAATGFITEATDPWLKLIFFPMNTEFFMGIAAAFIVTRLKRSVSLLFIISGTALFIAAGIFSNLGHSIVSNTFNRVIFFGIPSFLIIAGVVGFELLKKIKLHSILISLGEASYTLYLIHLPLVIAGIKILAKFNINNNIILNMAVCLIIFAVCAASIFFFKIIERPLTIRLNKILK